MKALRITIAGSLLLLATASLHAGPCKNVLVYYTSWSKYNSPAYNFTNLPYGELTHICYAFITPNADGSLTVPTDYMGADGVHYDGVSMVAAAHAAGVKVLVSCGGAGAGVDGNYTTLSASSSTINTFAANLLAYCQANHFDGVDIDWEYPNTGTKSTQFDSMLAGIRSQMPAPTWLLTAALSADDYEPTFLNISTLNNYLSFFNLMCYDYHGSWLAHSGDNAPLFEDSADPAFSHTASGVTAVNYYISNGASASKINYGLPFYGYGFNTAGLYQNCGGNCTTTTLTYAQIAPLVGVNWTRNWDASSDSPNLVYGGGASVISYDDTQSVTVKANYALNNLGLAGIFAWSADQDYNGSTQPLLTAMYQVASAGCGPTNTPTVTPTKTNTPTPVVQSTWRVNAGGPNYTDTVGNLWVADTNYTGGTGAAGGGAISGTSDSTLYDTQRYGASFSYSFNVPAGSYQVTLLFAETYSGDFTVGARVFNVAINGTTVLPNMDVYAQVGGNAADVKVLNNITPSGGSITIQFTGTASTDPNALVEAIQIIPMPVTPTFTPTRSSTSTSTATFTVTNTYTRTVTPTNTATATATRTNTAVPPTNTSTSSSTATHSFTPTATGTFTFTNTFTKTNSWTATSTRTFTLTSTNTATNTNSSTPAMTATFTFTGQPTSTSTNTPTQTKTFTSTSTWTSTGTATYSAMPSSTATSSNTATRTNSFTPSSTFTNTLSPAPSITSTHSFTPTVTSTSTATNTRTVTPTNTATATGTLPPTATFTNTGTPTSTFTSTFTRTNTSTQTPTSSSTSTSMPTHTSTFTLTATTVFTNTSTASSTSTATGTSTFSSTPTATSTSTPTRSLTRTFTPTFSYTQTQTLTPTPSWTETSKPTSTPGKGPTPVIYPNPITGPGPAHLSVPLTGVSNVEVQIFTTAFRKVDSFTVEDVAPGTAIDIPLTDEWGHPLADGLYYVFVQAQGKRWVVKLLVLN